MMSTFTISYGLQNPNLSQFTFTMYGIQYDTIWRSFGTMNEIKYISVQLIQWGTIPGDLFTNII